LDVELRLRTQDGSWRWMRARGAAILDAQQRIAEWLGVLEDVDDRKRAQAEVAYLALHDPLTGLPNRSLLQKPITTPGGTAGALLYLDLDRFKQVNDTLGHATGDALLCAVAERLRELLRDTDLVVRMGGDEFCIVQNASSAQAAASLAQRVIDRLSADYEIEGQRVSIGVSVGIALLTQPSDTQDPDSLLRKADMALYQAKQQGRGRYAFYTEALASASQ
jgi:diguanylate cyclase (GGDEF)-like protein